MCVSALNVIASLPPRPSVANVPYERAASFSSVLPGSRPLRLHEAHALFEQLTGMTWKSRTHWFRNLTSFADSTPSFVAAIRRPWTWRYHCILVHEQRVFDPELRRSCRVSQYPCRDWLVGFTLVPEDSHRLAAVQQFYAKNGTKQAIR